VRVAHVYKDYFPPTRGGIEQTVERMARAQVAAGHAVSVVCSAAGGRRTVDEVVDGVRVVRVAEWARALSAPLCPAMPRWLSRIEADLWHLHFPNPTGEVSFLLARPRGALVISYYSDVVRQAAALPLYGPVIEALMRRADVVLATSQPHVEHSPFLRRHRDKCRVVPLGIDLEPFERLEAHRTAGAALRARYGTPLVLFVGRLRYYKGLDVLLEAMPRVPGRLVIVGEGPEGEALRARHRRLGLGRQVVFAGDVDGSGLLDHLAAADVGVLPSTRPSEVFGLAMVEMMACGLPVVCTELGTGTSFVNRDGETGRVVAPGDPAALATALAGLLENEPLRRRMGDAARRRAHEHFATPAMMRGIEAAYDAALGHRRATEARGAAA